MITVIFSSYNGEQTVQKTLEGMRNLAAPRDGWKLVAIDNGSSDSTRRILEAYVDKLPMAILEVVKKGKNHALNGALPLIEGELVVFTDDDVVPDPQWLVNLSKNASENIEFGLFGGAIIPRWPEAQPPSWLMSHPSMEMVYATTPPEMKSGPVSAHLIWGPNMAVRRSVLDTGVKFSGDIGPDGSGTYIMGSETEFCRRLESQGVKAWFCADAKVEHLVRKNQLSTEWILQRFFRFGRAAYYFESNKKSASAQLFGAERWAIRRSIAAKLAAWVCLLRRDRNRAMHMMIDFNLMRGRIFQARSQRK